MSGQTSPFQPDEVTPNSPSPDAEGDSAPVEETFGDMIFGQACLGYAIVKGLTLAKFAGKRLVISIAADVPEGEEWRFPESERAARLLLAVTVPIEKERVDDARSWSSTFSPPKKTGRLIVPNRKIKPW